MNLGCGKEFECGEIVEEKGMKRVRSYILYRVDTRINR